MSYLYSQLSGQGKVSGQEKLCFFLNLFYQGQEDFRDAAFWPGKWDIVYLNLGPTADEVDELFANYH